MALTLPFTFTSSWHWPDPNILAKDFPFLWLLAKNQQLRDALAHRLLLCRQNFCTRGHVQETALLLYLGKSPYKDSNSPSSYDRITEILQPRKAVDPYLEM